MKQHKQLNRITYLLGEPQMQWNDIYLIGLQIDTLYVCVQLGHIHRSPCAFYKI